jgi:hypothetical protein
VIASSLVPSERHFRAFARRSVNLPATLRTPTTERAPARLVNLGLGGACVEAGITLDIGHSVTLEVSAPNLWDPLVVPAQITWVKKRGKEAVVAGLAFRSPEEASLPALVELLSAYRYE